MNGIRCARVVLFACACLHLAQADAQGRGIDALHSKALAAYNQALEHYGVAMGERGDSADPAQKLLMGSVAELICLRGDRQGCLDASRQVDRSLGPYSAALGELVSPDPRTYAVARRFLRELHRRSAGWDKDRSLASEALGLLRRIRGDFLRRKARRAAAPAFARAVRRARRVDWEQAGRAWLQAGRLAWLMLDQQATVQASCGLADWVIQAEGDVALVVRAREALAVLRRGRDVLAIVGRAPGPDADRIDRALAALGRKELAAAELEFPLAPAESDFRTDLPKAREQLRSLADKAPAGSRARVLLGFFAAYAEVIIGEPGAYGALEDLLSGAVADRYLVARARGLLGRSALLGGDFHRAAVQLARAISELEGQTACAGISGRLTANRAQALFFMGRYGEAVEAFSAAAAQLQSRPVLVFQALLGAAHARAFAGAFGQAQADLERAEALVPRLPTQRRAAFSRALLLDRALLEVGAKRFDDALAIYVRVAAQARRAGDRRAEAVARTNLAELYNDRGQSERALHESQTALERLDLAAQADVAWQALCERGRALASAGRARQAAQSYRRAMELVERLRSKIGAEGSRRSFAAAKERLYRHAVSLLTDAGQGERAFWVSERARSRAFLDMLGERHLRLGDPRQQARLGPARAQMLKSLPPLAIGFDEPGAGLRAETETKRNASPLPRADPSQGWLSLVVVNPARVSDLQRILAVDEGLLSFFHDGRRLIGFLVTRGHLTWATAEIDPRGLASRVHDLLRTLRRPDRGVRRVQGKAQRLFAVTFAPQRGRLGGIRRLVVVPWGPLHYVPFGALWDGERYLIDRYELSTVPSASTLVMIRSDRRLPGALRRRAVLAMGNPATDLDDLPAAAREAELLGRLFPDAEVRKGRRATKRFFLSVAPSSRLIHLASHGVFLPDRPMDSYLALAGPHGRLAATEVLGLDLRGARLVMLSACSSAQLRVERGDEIVGFSRAFLHAGTPALVASLWPLSDEGALEMVSRFYGGIRRGLHPAGALHRAARELKENERFSHPFYWAPFALIGS